MGRQSGNGGNGFPKSGGASIAELTERVLKGRESGMLCISGKPGMEGIQGHYTHSTTPAASVGGGGLDIWTGGTGADKECAD